MGEGCLWHPRSYTVGLARVKLTSTCLPRPHSQTTQQVPTKLIRQYQERLPVLQGHLLFQRIQYWAPCCQLKAEKNKISIRVNRTKKWKFIDEIFTLTKKNLIATAIRNSDLPTNFAIKAIEPGSFDFLVISNSQPFPLDALVSHLLSVISNIFPLFRTIFSFPLRHSAVIVKSSAHCIAKLLESLIRTLIPLLPIVACIPSATA